MGATLSTLSCLLRWSQHAEITNTASEPDSLADPCGVPPSDIQDDSPSSCATYVPRLFALIIGINDYSNCRPLSGAVTDAKAMRDYLKESLRVPSDHIRILLNDQATRHAMIQALKDMRADERIKSNDPIMIFFAGHGGQLPPPASWGTKSDIQWLLPYDYERKHTYAIPDRAVGVLIDEIAEAKGNNITVIFDCCYSAGCARAENDELVPRTVELDPDIPANLDSDIWGGRAGAIPAGFSHHGIRSHVLLAACGEKEYAYERDGRGQFTNALLEMLKSHTAGAALTYAQLLERIRLERQSPHCVGINQHRMLFDVKVPAGGRLHYYVQPKSGGKCLIHAGLVHGVSRGAKFTLYDHHRQKLGVASVDDNAVIEDFHTVVDTDIDLTGADAPNLTAKLTLVQFDQIPVYLAREGNFSERQAALQRIISKGSHALSFRIVEEAKEAILEVGMKNDRVNFIIRDEKITRFGLSALPHTATLDNVAYALGAITHYYAYLSLTNEKCRVGTNNGISVNFFRLKKKSNIFDLLNLDMDIPFLTPDPPGLCEKDPLLDGSFLIDFAVDQDALYGVEIKNNTPRDLYLNAWLFNNSSFSIVPCYIQSKAGNPEAPLKRNGTFTLGYDEMGGTAPLGFSLIDGQDVDVAYLKFFFATRPIDLTDVEQISPFSGLNTRLSTDEDARDGVVADVRADARDVWFTVVIPVVQRRRQE